VSDVEMERRILETEPRLTESDGFTFSCHPGVTCFNRCCGDVTIVLTPYDVLRLKNRLGISSEEFLDRYALLPFHEEQRLPSAVLRMREDEGRTCPFVSAEGCTVYEDRPWACRMYPLGLASPTSVETREDGFYFVLREDRCQGHAEGRSITVAGWLDEQGIRPYEEMGEQFKEVRFHEFFRSGRNLDPRQMHMYFTACYDLDAFRRFVLESSFLRRFEVDEETLAAIRTDDVALMRFAFRWLRYSLFGETRLMTPRADAGRSDQQERAK
jgi:Fe-S-cluster containining protein